MKKSLYLIAALTVFGAAMAVAQPRAIGGRLGAFEGFSYQHGFGESNMLELEVGWSVNGRLSNGNGTMWGHNFQLAATYDWIDPFGANFSNVWEHKGMWHWYMGVGGAAGYGWHAFTTGANGSLNWGFVGAAGRVGVEYDFWFPLQLSVDYRPTLGLGLADNGTGGAQGGLYWEMTSISLGVRYKF